jgi:signal transduction histidine kinase/ActR/RegA family two-component response regulator
VAAVNYQGITLTRPSPRRFKLFVGAAASLAFATLVAVRAIDLRGERAQLLSAADRRAEGLAVVFAGYLTQTFAAFDASLRQLALHSGRIGGPSASDAEWAPALVAARAALSAVGSITVVDSAGIVRHSTQPLIVGRSRRDSYLFRVLATDTADVVVADPPFQSVTSDHAYLIPLGRRLRGPHGEFAGVVVATFRPDEVRQFVRGADIGKEGMISLFHRNGFVVLREPSTENPIGENASHAPIFEAAATTDTLTTFEGRAVPNGPVLRTAYRPLPERDLVVAVSLSEREVLQQWRRETRLGSAIGMVGALILVTIVLLIFRETDRRVAAEQTLTRSQQLESLGRLTGGIAHDFNNLLTVILGNFALIRDVEPSSSSPIGEASEQIERAASRGSALVRQLLAFARRRPLQARTVDLGALARDTKPMIDRVLGEDVQVQIRIPAGPPFLATVDPTGVESALLNLCINARDAMPNGGTIAVELSRATVRAADASQNPDVTPGAYVAMTVADTGAGIPDEHLPHLFEPFFTTKDVGRGTGLGLSMIYGFVKQSGGSVTVRSDVGQGTVVTMFLPEGRDADLPERNEPVETSSDGNGETILLVEDEPELLTLASRFLTELGYRVIPASNGAAALEAASGESRIDLVLTDVVMPGGMSGLDLASTMRSRRPETRVVFVSGYADKELTDKRPNATERIISKPYDRRELAKAVQQALKDHSSG